MTRLPRALGEPRIKKWEARRFKKRCDREMREAQRKPQFGVGRPHECGGVLSMRVREHCWCLGRPGPHHRHLVCENCGDVGWFEHERRELRRRHAGHLTPTLPTV